MTTRDAAARDVFGEFVVGEILDHTGKTKKDLKFLVHWDGFDHEWNSWEPYSLLKDVEKLDVYCKKVAPKLDFLL